MTDRHRKRKRERQTRQKEKERRKKGKENKLEKLTTTFVLFISSKLVLAIESVVRKSRERASWQGNLLANACGIIQTRGEYERAIVVSSPGTDRWIILSIQGNLSKEGIDR